MHLADAPGGASFIDDGLLDRGAELFGEHCGRCHSSKQPADGQSFTALLQDRAAFLDGNFLSNEQRYPVNEPGLHTNAGRALGTNATRDHVWDNFSSESYKNLPSVGTIEAYNPVDEDTPLRFEAPRGGVGYNRPPSLISLWSSAPFLHNNSVGDYNGDPSVAGRMAAFQDAAEKLLGLAPRLGKESIYRTTTTSYLEIPESVVPEGIRKLLRIGDHIDKDGILRLGPIPKGTPVSLLLSLNVGLGELDGMRDMVKRAKTLAELAIRLKRTLRATKDMAEAEAFAHMKRELVPTLLEASKCPDLIVDRGHTFGNNLTPDDKRALIEFLKLL
jgi:hypothetical protein